MAAKLPHDPLPEPQFLYRRITTWVVSLIILAIIAWNVTSLHDLGAIWGIVDVTYWLIILLGIVLTYYLIAPSAEQIVKFVQLGGIFKATNLIPRMPEEPAPLQAQLQVAPSSSSDGTPVME